MSQFKNDDIDSFFAEMQDVKPIASDDKALLHDPEKALAEKQSAEARVFNDYFKAAALTEATICVYRMQFLGKLSQGAKALEEELLGY